MMWLIPITAMIVAAQQATTGHQENSNGAIFIMVFTFICCFGLEFMGQTEMTKQVVKRFWCHGESGTMTPSIKVKKCTCGNLPSYYASIGGFNYYGYYKCDTCNLFATGRHQFPAIGIPGFGDNEDNEPRLFVVYNGENNPEDGWNNFISELTKAEAEAV